MVPKRAGAINHSGGEGGRARRAQRLSHPPKFGSYILEYSGGWEANMRIWLLVAALVLSNLGWFGAYRALDRARLQDIVWRHQTEKERDFFQDQALKLNADLGKMCLCRK